MAINVSRVYSKPRPIDTSNPWAESLPQAGLMTSIMPYQHPLLPSLNGEVDMSHPAYAPTYNGPQPNPSHLGPFSSPNPAMAPSNLESQPPQTVDRKRNKLGYHRTTIACGHCRKRKIRCVPALADLHGRCVNCIRLKKECCFYPVDQPPPSEGQQSMQPPAILPAPSGSVHPYPAAVSSGNLGEIPASHPFSPLAPQPSNVPTQTLKSNSAGLFPLDTEAPLPSSSERQFDFTSPSVASWVPGDASQSPGSKPADLSQAWRGYPPESPVSAQFSPFGPATPSGPWTPGSSEAGSREDMPWTNYPPPVRSMSYGGEPLTSHQSQYPPIPHQGRQFDRRASTLSDVYTPSVGVSVPGMEAGLPAGMEPTGPLSARTAPLSPFGGWNDPQHAPSAPPTYPYPAWGHGENGMDQDGYSEHGQQLPNNDSSHNAYFATR